MSAIATAMVLFAGAQSQLSLPEAIRLAEAHSTAIQSAQAQFGIARARVGQQSSRYAPQLSLGGSATQFDNKTTVSFPGIGNFELAPDHQEQLGVMLNENLDLSGQVGASVAQARLQAASAKYALEAAQQDQDLATTTTYYDVLRAGQAVKVAQASLDAYREQLKTTTKLYQGGVGQKIDVDRSESQVADADSELARRQNALDSARSSLNDLIGRPLDTPEELTDVQAQAQNEQSRPTLIAEALDRRPEALAATVDVAAAKKGIKIADSSQEPTLSIGLGDTYYPTTSFQEPRQNVGALSLSVSIPLFDGGLARERVREARATVDSAKVRQDRIRRDIALQVQNASLDVDTARKRLDAASASLKAAVAARALAQQRYEAQVGLYIEVTDAQAALTSAQAAQVDATYDLLTAQARLARSLSEPLVR